MKHSVHLSFCNKILKKKKSTARKMNSHLLHFLSYAQEETAFSDELNSEKCCFVRSS